MAEAYAKATASDNTECKNQCQLNGECVKSQNQQPVCVCDRGWTGIDCGTLNLDLNATIAYGMGATPNTSSWGGGPPAYDKSTGTFHLFLSEIAGHCGMTTWSRMSQGTHAVSKNIEGPYTKVETVIGTEAHNIYYAYSEPDKMHLLYHIFNGQNPPSCNTYYPCSNGSTPNAPPHGLRPPPNWPGGQPSCPTKHATSIHYSRSLDGPWLDAGPITFDLGHMPPTGGTSNPAPYIFPNGTVLMLARGKDSGVESERRPANHNIVLFRANSWNETYEYVPSNGVNGTVGIGDGSVPTEDPVLWRGRRGFHALLHSSPDLTHAWSEDGITWQWSPNIIGPPTLHGDNERPRVTIDSSGDLSLLWVGQLCGPGDSSRTAVFSTLG